MIIAGVERARCGHGGSFRCRLRLLHGVEKERFVGVFPPPLFACYPIFVVANSEILFVVDPNRIYYPRLHRSNKKKVANAERELKI